MTLSRTINLLLLLALVVAIWAVEVVNEVFFDHELNRYGILPRTVEGLRGIAFSPFLHGGFGHLAANTLPLLALGGLIAVRGRGSFPGVTVFIIGVGGAGVWLAGRTALHVGASGLVFGYFGYLVARGWYERSVLSILVALAVILVFGWGMLFGLLPTEEFVSYEGHLCGLAAGVLVAWLTRPRRGEKRAAPRHAPPGEGG